MIPRCSKAYIVVAWGWAGQNAMRSLLQGHPPPILSDEPPEMRLWEEKNLPCTLAGVANHALVGGASGHAAIRPHHLEHFLATTQGLIWVK